jgi:hypothetical protein
LIFVSNHTNLDVLFVKYGTASLLDGAAIKKIGIRILATQ